MLTTSNHQRCGVQEDHRQTNKKSVKDAVIHLSRASCPAPTPVDIVVLAATPFLYQKYFSWMTTETLCLKGEKPSWCVPGAFSGDDTVLAAKCIYSSSSSGGGGGGGGCDGGKVCA